MGDFVVRVHAIGGHGCQRDTVKDGGTLVFPCGPQCSPNCIDRMASDFVESMKRVCSPTMVKAATLTHWPVDVPGYSGQDQVTDNLLTGKRKGSF